MSVYEFGPNPTSREPGNRRVITGKRIRFQVDHSLVNVTNRRSGPHFVLKLYYDFKTLGPIIGDSPNTVSATIGYRQIGGNLTAGNITRSDGGFGFIGQVPPGGLVKRPDRLCGMDAYDVKGLGSHERISTSPYAPHPKAVQFVERFGGSMVFGVPGPDGVYGDVISCSRELPTCQADTSYRGWPVSMTFGNEHVCDYQEIAASSRLLFDRFYLDETDRSPGQPDRLWHPAEIREATR